MPAIDVNGFKVLQCLWAAGLEEKARLDALCRLWPDKYGPWDSSSAQSGGEIGDRPTRGKRPPRAVESLKTGRSDQRYPRVDPDMHVQRLCAMFLIESRGGGQYRKGGVRSFTGVHMDIGVMKDRHKAVTSGLIDIAIHLVNTIQKRRKIALIRVLRAAGVSSWLRLV